MSKTLEELGAHLKSVLPEMISKEERIAGEVVLHTSPKFVERVMSYLRDDAECLFTILCDVTAVDYPSRPLRFEVVYNLLSVKHNQRIRVKLAVDEDTAVPSIVSVFPTAGWFERETWDMYGVYFSGNPDLRRILTDYGFDGHPQRKDFPLTGYVELRYDEERKRVVYEPVKLPQAYRLFDFESPWEGGYYKDPVKATYVLPGDEKAGVK